MNSAVPEDHPSSIKFGNYRSPGTGAEFPMISVNLLVSPVSVRYIRLGLGSILLSWLIFPVPKLTYV